MKLGSWLLREACPLVMVGSNWWRGQSLACGSSRPVNKKETWPGGRLAQIRRDRGNGSIERRSNALERG
jgi:hypothetical protein